MTIATGKEHMLTKRNLFSAPEKLHRFNTIFLRRREYEKSMFICSNHALNSILVEIGAQLL